MRSYIAAPKEAIAQAPEIYRRYRDLVPKEVREVVDEYSKQYRIFEGASAHEKEMASVRMDMDEVKSNILKDFFSKEGRKRISESCAAAKLRKILKANHNRPAATAIQSKFG